MPETHSSTGGGEPQWARDPLSRLVIKQLLIAWCLMASNVAIHASGMVAAVTLLRRKQGAVSWTLMFVGLAGWIILLHVSEIIVWASAYAWLGAMPDMASAMVLQRRHLHDHRIRRPGAAAIVAAGRGG